MIIAHTPDADDAFMFYGVQNGKIRDTEMTQVIADIETLNKIAFRGELDVTAHSAHIFNEVLHFLVPPTIKTVHFAIRSSP
ncbi:hypothetical protein DRN97_03475 [Methanosarcinales archaeon]|nr:MAG: hypothetical protein DRN97_03475 [Methanosarcinales archaeon]